MLINFISHLPADLRSGGFSALGAAACEAIGKACQLGYVGPVNPKPSLHQKLISKALRTAGMPGDFFFFSERRLGMIAAQVEAACDAKAGLDFFHGITSWIATTPARPYLALSDCSFRDYISHYHRRADFRVADLARIERQEAAWLGGAARIAFTSQWAATRTIRDYSLDPARVCVVGIFGEIEKPDCDAFAGGQQFAFVSTNFAAKGGPNVLAAFRAVRARHPGASLVIVGDTPAGMTDGEGVTFAGFLRKESPEECQRLRDILAVSRALVHPTRSDISPHILVEAGYFGCPVISTRQFAIGEIVRHGETGLLIDDPSDVAATAAAMEWMLEAEHERYQAMRRAAWSHTRAAHSRERFEERVLAMIESAGLARS